MNIIKEIFKKRDGVFAVQLFANDRFSLSEFDEQHLIFRMPIKGLWKSKPILFQADPFLFVKNGCLYLFYEEQKGFSPGRIMMMKTYDLKSWTVPLVVLQEPFHLSFPFVFEDDGIVYMIPESGEDQSIRLYESNDDLTSFRFVRTLLKQELRVGPNSNYVDNHIYKKNGVYFLFTSYRNNWEIRQELFTSSNLLSNEFVKHPCSPICLGNKYGRNGGSLIEQSGELLRVSQDCSLEYGTNVSLHKITTINEKQYSESLFEDDVFSGNSLFPNGGHQLNIAFFLGKYVYGTDYRVVKWTWYHLFHSAMIFLGFIKR